ncbi:MAG: GntR family transcriptional regulator [Desulfobacteraceae bacterium]|nr:GntR family transcriptional regulator [Desulfobacteraceae bacterium]
MLNHQSPIPLYHQLADLLITRIRSGEYAVGGRIPSENVLAETHGIGRPTVRQAIDLLVRKGLVAKKRGAGTYVQSDEHEADILSLAGTTSAFSSKGITVEMTILTPTAITPIGEDPDNPFSGREAFRLSRLSSVDRSPVLVEDIYLDPVIFPGIDKIDLNGLSLARVVKEQFYMEPAGGRQTFRIGYVPVERAKVLGISPNDPILVVNRYLNFAHRENGLYSELFCRTDHFTFSQTLGAPVNER